jgi:DNA-binding NarL/FixJ family response regulator
MVTLVIIEPDPLRREGLTVALSRIPHLRITALGSDLLGTLSRIRSAIEVDVILVNIDSPDMIYWGCWALLRLVYPRAAIVAMTHGGDERALQACVAIGARGLYRYSAGALSIERAVERAIRGDLCYDPTLADRIRNALVCPPTPKTIQMGPWAVPVAANGTGGRTTASSLTRREREVLALLTQGRSNQQIANALGVTARTAAFHVGNIMAKLRVSSRAEAGLLAQWLGGQLQLA